MFREGSQIGVYTLIRKLGRGGFGEVWLAEKRSQFITKKVAIKLPHEEQVNFEAIRQEATLWEQASGHPNVLPIIDADIYDEQVIIVSEYADGGSLADKLKAEGKLPMQQVLEICVGILNGLHFLHSRKIIHRDIKPQNILLQGETPRLADFGISRAMQTTAISSTVIGTDAYMSPEAFDGKRSVQTDIWSVGILLYALLADELPFPQEHPSERMFAVLTKDFEPLPSEIPNNLKEIVKKALQKLPENRYQTAIEMRDDIQKVLIGMTHPSLAKTEVLNNQNFSETSADVPTVISDGQSVQTHIIQSENKPQEDLTEIKTIVSDVPPTIYQPAPQQSETQTVVKQNLSQNDAVSTTKQTTSFLKPEIIVILSLVLIVGLFGILLVLYQVWQFNSDSGGLSSNSNTLTTTTPDPNYVFTNANVFQEGDKYGFKNSDGKIIIPAKYEMAMSFTEGLASVKYDGKYGFIDEKDTTIIPFKYENSYPFKDGLSAVKMDGKWGYIDKSDKIVIPYKYENAGYFYDGLSKVGLNGKYGFIDKTGNEVIPFKYGYTGDFGQGFAMACNDYAYQANCGFIDKTGKEIGAFKYDLVYSFSEDGIVMVTLNSKHGYLDKTGKEIIPPKYDYGSSFISGSAEVELNGRKYKIDKNGNETDIGSATITNSSTTSNTAANKPASNITNTTTNTYSNTSNSNSNY